MKPRERPRLLRLTMDGYFDGTLGSDPVHQDRPHHGLDLSTLEGAVLIPKPFVRMIPRATAQRRRKRIHGHPRTAGPVSDTRTCAIPSWRKISERGSAVRSASECRELADKCFQSAREAQTDAERMMYFTLAQTWLEEASRRDSAMPVRLPPAPQL